MPLPPLKPYQALAIQFAYENDRCAIWADPGAGKTRAALELIRALWRFGDARRVLVLSTKFPARTTWLEQCRRWTPELTVDYLPDNWDSTALIHTCNYEQADNLIKHTAAPYDVVVLDESTKVQSFRLRQGGKRAQALRTILTTCRRLVELTGTPSSQRLLNLWGQLYFVDFGERLGRSFTAFKDRWFVQTHSRAIVPTQLAVDEIPVRIADVCLSIRLRDYIDIAEPVHVKIDVDLPDVAKKQYRRLERNAFLEIRGEGHRAVNAGAKCTKLLQLASGTLYTHGDDGEISGVQYVHDAKLNALAALMDEYQESLLIAYWFRPDLERIRKRFPTVRDARDKGAIAEFQAGHLQYLAVQPQSAGHGLDLHQNCRAICYYSDSWDMELHDQVLERIGPARQEKLGRKDPVMAYTLCARGTLDEAVIECHRSKRAFQDLLRDRVTQLLG